MRWGGGAAGKLCEGRGGHRAESVGSREARVGREAKWNGGQALGP